MVGWTKGALALAIAGALALVNAGAAIADGEFEPNDSITQTAGPLVAGVNYEATQDTDNDVDWFRFYTGGQVQLTVTSIGLSDYMDCELELDDRRGEYVNSDYFESGEFSDLRQTLYKPGIYYIQVNCGSDDTGDRYRFSLTPVTATVSEACGLSLGARTGARRDLSKAQDKVAKALARKRTARGKRAKQRAKARLRRARGIERNAQATLAGWDAAIAANC